MPKYSIIVPVYNSEKYLDDCLKSIFNQTNQDYEVICINDGSTDKSLDILNKYKNDIIIIDQDNRGLSVARNNGVKKASGKYLLFVDSDDVIENKLLEKIDIVSKNNPDLIRFGIIEVNGDNKENIPAPIFNNLSGNKAFKEIVKNKYVEPAWLYAYRREFYIKNKFEFLPNMYHEDFGLVPRIIMLASKVTSIEYPGYNYIKRENSITTDSSKNLKRVNDFLTQGKILLKEDNFEKEYYSYIANCIISKARQLKGKDRRKYVKNIKKLKLNKYLLSDTFGRKIKKILVSISINLYLKVCKK